ncbi:carboxylesterase family protein [Gelidibacter pelagius]|uniref:Prolyl oligopeptidase family serine peptidase n=1 Tax=Gelidibacter pelagius TaxID=2819985 RepID=A0ABS3SQ06_9FLAO|nr:prolyl oligopeptidase family serine peptidase [Gelidibacter pelagius]MBO3097781.1 prolyl oligopeptidase family serine peptidase [Gelidibacter pelagius]
MSLNIKNIIFIITVLLLNPLKISAQHEDYYIEEQFVSGNDTLNYRVLMPKSFESPNQFPVALFLHGAGERGSDNTRQLTHGSELFYKMRDSFPAIVIFPQCPQNDYWANVTVDRSTRPLSLSFPVDSAPTKSMSLVMQLMDKMLTKPYVKKDQVYVGGLSMGGMGTFEILYRKPEVFAAAFAICGAGNPDATEAYAKTVPMWIFHGANDDVVGPQESVDMVSGILKYGGKPNFSLFAKDNHNSWDSAFAEPELIPWLFSNSKSK